MIKLESDLLTFGDTQQVKQVKQGVKRQIMGYDEKLMIVRSWFDEGSTGFEQSRSETQVSYVVSGEFDISIAGQVTKMKGGDSFRIPSDVSYGAVCTKNGMLIDVFSPVREDLLIEAA